MRLDELATRIGAELRGDAAAEVGSCATLEDAGPGQVTFLSNPRYRNAMAATRASAVVVAAGDAQAVGDAAALVADDPYFAFRQVMVALHGRRPLPPVGISPEASIDETAVVGSLCTVRPGAYVAPRARLGDRVVLYPNVYVGKGAVVGHDCVLHPGVCVYDRCVLGDRVTLHANTVIGQDGFGYATAKASGDDETRHHKIPPAGNAVVENDVEMGANCSIDRAALGSTVVGAGSKLSNNVVLGHGVRLGRRNLLVAHVGIAGSTTTGDDVAMGGQAGVAGHLRIGHRVEIAAAAKVMHDLPDDSGRWGGVPARPLTEAKRAVLQQQHLPELVKRVRDLERRLGALEDQSRPV